MNHDYRNLLLNAIIAAYKAGEAILSVYGTDFSVDIKEDKSPLTDADRESHNVIKDMLSGNEPFPEIPFLSEEGRDIQFDERDEWKYMWLVDPLDGTKEFVNRNGEFTVNIALIRAGKPIIGIVYIPVKEKMYFAKENDGSYLIRGKQWFINESKTECVDAWERLIKFSEKLPVSENGTDGRAVRIIASRSHLSTETEKYIEKIKAEFSEIEIVPSGSALKLCRIAEGSADVYPRFAPTMEWDTGAGQAVVEYAGGFVVRVDNNKPLTYNRENLVNPWFIAAKDRKFADIMKHSCIRKSNDCK